METEVLDQNLKYVNLNGVTLSLDEKLNLQLAFEQLKNDFKLNEVFFWGKLIGTVKDYFVVMTLDYKTLQNGFPAKRFFWCSSSNFIFASLPLPLLQHAAKFENMKTYLTGEYDRVLIQNGGAPVVIDELAGIIIPPKNITELDRVSYIIHTIEQQCQVVPRHSYKYTPLQEIRQNEAFQGLSRGDAFCLSSYHHFRPMQQTEKLLILQREEAIYNDDILDEITKDYPKQCWSIVKDCGETVATVKSLLWPGYYAYHRVNTPIFGGVYIGYGIRNQDLPFML